MAEAEWVPLAEYLAMRRRAQKAERELQFVARTTRGGHRSDLKQPKPRSPGDDRALRNRDEIAEG